MSMLGVIGDMRVRHVYDSSFVLQEIMHKLEQFEEIVIKEIALQFDYDESTVYKLLKKIDLNFAKIDAKFKVVRIGCGIYKLFNSSEMAEELEK